MKPIQRISFLLLIAISFILNSCSNEPIDPAIDPSANNGSSSGIYKWSFKLDGVLYEWEGTLQDGATGGGNYNVINNKGMLNLSLLDNSSPVLAIIIQFPNASTGNFTFNASSPTSEGFTYLKYNPNFAADTYMSSFGGTMNVSITSISTNTLATNPTNPGKVIGTFSGTIKKGGSQALYTITEGSFEAMRGQ
jgi:hypothetical protein